MSTQILATKLYKPVLRHGSILRPRLINRLNTGFHGKLTLISAPAGFGKTTLITEWISSGDHATAWLSLDESDSAPVRFLNYFVAALETIAPQIGARVSNALRSPQPPPIDSLLTQLLNAIATIPVNFVLVLDDYHVIDSTEIDSALSFLIDNLPSQMHLIISTREDPPLPLARLRARGQLTELRAAELRFTSHEATAFLNQTMGLALSSEAVEALEHRTEGWIVGLQLAALSMQGQPDAHQFIQSFTSSHHFVLDYLIEEVLNHQPPYIHDFLLKTAILQQLCGSLCDAILQDASPSGVNTLERIRQANLFLIPLDNERQWYRYHHLFGDLIRKRLHESPHIDVKMLHSRASAWYEANRLEMEAFHHAVAADDIVRSERLIEGHGTALYLRGGFAPILRWFDSLPQSAFDERPSLWVTYAAASTVAGQQIDRIEDRLLAAEIALQNDSHTARNRVLLGQIAAVRSMLAVPHGDIESMLSKSKLALEMLPTDSLSMRLFALWTNGMAHQLSGEDEIARQIYAEIISIGEAAGNTMMVLAVLTNLGQLQEEDNQLDQAQVSYQRVLALVGEPPWPMACEAYLGLARIHYVWNDLEQAEEFGLQGYELGRQIENVNTPIKSGILLARVRIARGELNGAASILEESERLVKQRGFTDKMPEIRVERTRIQQFITIGNPTPVSQSLVEPLSERELEVLRLVADGLSNREIGEQLFLALDTVKGHNRRIYAKLGVQRRTEAVARAKELCLL
ncbi:MAG: AAA family ATPase [Anaerolineaceae bacterium]|nr:AAA family ATPase [Anaerolineaceae bacterium]